MQPRRSTFGIDCDGRRRPPRFAHANLLIGLRLDDPRRVARGVPVQVASKQGHRAMSRHYQWRSLSSAA